MEQYQDPEPGFTFSILERIVVVETDFATGNIEFMVAFSILERIVVVETPVAPARGCSCWFLSVSSNGSWWLKPKPYIWASESAATFQYPRTDRGG